MGKHAIVTILSLQARGTATPSNGSCLPLRVSKYGNSLFIHHFMRDNEYLVVSFISIYSIVYKTLIMLVYTCVLVPCFQRLLADRLNSPVRRILRTRNLMREILKAVIDRKLTISTPIEFDKLSIGKRFAVGMLSCADCSPYVIPPLIYLSTIYE